MKPGDKVKCTADTFIFGRDVPKEYNSISLPKRMVEYTVREVVDTPFGRGIRLEEIKNPEIYHDKGGWQEPIFGTNRFDPA